LPVQEVSRRAPLAESVDLAGPGGRSPRLCRLDLAQPAV